MGVKKSLRNLENRFSVSDVCEALDTFYGLIQPAARRLKCSRMSLYNYIEKHPELKKNVQVMMMQSVSGINWDDCTEGVPAFLIFAGIPFSNSIIGGISIGIILYPFLKICTGKIREVNWFTGLSAAVLILYLILLNGK